LERTLYPFHIILGEPRAGLDVFRTENLSLMAAFVTVSTVLTLAHPLVMPDVRNAFKILRYSGDDAPYIFIERYQHFGDTFSPIFRVEVELAGLTTIFFYHTVFQSTFLKIRLLHQCLLSFTHCSDQLPLFPAATGGD
jgi:hypothetical protein